MYQPSDAKINKEDDSTTLKLKKILNNNNYGGVIILNLFTIRINSEIDNPNKNVLDNYDIVLTNSLQLFQSNNIDIIYAWGNKGGSEPEYLKNIIINPWCIDKNKTGNPSQPLKWGLPDNIRLSPYDKHRTLLKDLNDKIYTCINYHLDDILDDLVELKDCEKNIYNDIINERKRCTYKDIKLNDIINKPSYSNIVWWMTQKMSY